MKAPKLSLVSGTLNRHEGARRLVDSIIENTSVPFEVVIADASDVPFVYDDPRVRILPERPRLGYAKGHNRAFRQCRGEYVLWLNDDAEVCPRYAENAVAFMDRNAHIGLGALYYSNRGEPFCAQIYLDMVYSNFGIIRRELGNRLGWFWEELRMYGTDNAISFDVLLAGYGVAGIPNACVIHHEVDDINRVNNQIGRNEAADKLNAKYLPKERQMLETYHRALERVVR